MPFREAEEPHLSIVAERLKFERWNVQRLAGFPDLDQRRLAAIEGLRTSIFDILRSFGYGILEPPIVDLPDAFIERSGEGIRDKMYFLQDPRGRELCLRPELTIPTCRMLLGSNWDRQSTVRAGYHGPVFRYEATGRGRYRQFGQIGAECIGHGQSLVADAEIVALAQRAVRSGGVDTPWILFGDIRFLDAVLGAFAIPERLRRPLKAALPQIKTAAGLRAQLDAHKKVLQGDEDPKQREFMRALSELGPERSAQLIERILAMSDISLVGTRQIPDMVRRLTDIEAADRISVSDAVIGEILRFASIAAPPMQALRQMERFCKDHKIDIVRFADETERRLSLIHALGVETENSWFEASLRRPVEYYTGFIFEIYASATTRDTQLAGGGRYDQLIRFLEPTADIPAVGFAIGVERLLSLRDTDETADGLIWDVPVDAVIAIPGKASEDLAMRVATELRRGGWAVRAALSERAEDIRDIPYSVRLDGTDTTDGAVIVTQQGSGIQERVPLDGLASFARAKMSARRAS